MSTTTSTQPHVGVLDPRVDQRDAAAVAPDRNRLSVPRPARRLLQHARLVGQDRHPQRRPLRVGGLPATNSERTRASASCAASQASSAPARLRSAQVCGSTLFGGPAAPERWRQLLIVAAGAPVRFAASAAPLSSASLSASALTVASLARRRFTTSARLELERRCSRDGSRRNVAGCVVMSTACLTRRLPLHRGERPWPQPRFRCGFESRRSP
jgi:hypothetical protein